MAVDDKGQREPSDDGRLPGQTHSPRPEPEQGAAHAELQRAAAEHARADRPQPFGIEFEPDHEQHEHHAELGKVQNGLDVFDELEAERADHAACDQVAQHRAELEARGQRYEQHGRREIDHGIEQHAVVNHASAPTRARAGGGFDAAR